MNKIFLIGNLAADPETRSTTSGVTACNFRLAVQRRYVNQETGRRDADFFNIVAWRQLGELCSKYLAKGRKCAVTGSVQIRTYEAQDGSKRTAFDVIADEVEFLGSSQNASNRLPEPPPERNAQSAASGFTETNVDDDELPF